MVIFTTFTVELIVGTGWELRIYINPRGLPEIH